MPVYNAQAYVEDAIASILSQSYRNLELVAVDDGSTDGTWQILNNACKADERLRAVRNDTNHGIVDALNRGLTLAGGRLIARMDADDLALPRRIEQQVRFLQGHPDIAICGTGIIEIHDSGDFFRRKPIVVGPEHLRALSSWCSPLAHPTLMFRREILRVLEGYRQVAPAEDYDFLLRAVDAGFRIDNVPAYGLRLRIASSNTASQRGLMQRKAFNYVKRLQAERRRRGTDSYSPGDFQKAVHCSSFYVACHRLSQRLFSRAVVAKHARNPLLLLYLLGSMFLSPHQIQFVFRNLVIRVVFLWHKHAVGRS